MKGKEVFNHPRLREKIKRRQTPGGKNSKRTRGAARQTSDWEKKEPSCGLARPPFFLGVARAPGKRKGPRCWKEPKTDEKLVGIKRAPPAVIVRRPKSRRKKSDVGLASVFTPKQTLVKRGGMQRRKKKNPLRKHERGLQEVRVVGIPFSNDLGGVKQPGEVCEGGFRSTSSSSASSSRWGWATLGKKRGTKWSRKGPCQQT